MPKVFEKDGYRFFYSNEHRPIHVHVRCGTGEAVFNVDPVVELRESIGPAPRSLRAPTKRLSSRSGMNTLTDTARSACLHEGFIVITMESGAQLHFSVAENARLAAGTPAQINHIELSPFGLHWPDLDEDLSLRGIAEGNYGQPPAKRGN